MLLTVILFIAPSAAYDPSGANVLDFACAEYLGNECPYWMRCYSNGKYSKSHTEKGCREADLEFNGNASWARKFRGRIFGGNQNCPDLASTFCPTTGGVYFQCLSE
ncbi:hypothetical protein DSO57_1007145 [Entomophthora muscae]|uniref:Uncharacterized protein n=1 Tax=Entomophthora muscae TaxID=34485 RepID=A0ACC2T7T6_9FUNG|nr:hypothetical protein DSO57_1007145 [Entomophthora muscae]